MLKLTHALRSTVSGTLVALVTSLSFAPMTWASESVSESPNIVSAERLETIINYENQFKTVGALLNEMADMGKLTSQEKKGIETFLESRHFSLETKVTPASLSGSSARWGSMSLTWMENGNVKTQNGRILHANASDSKDKIFIDTFNAMTGKEVSSNLTRLLLPSAKADQFVNPFDAIGAVLGGIARTIGTALDVLFVLPVCGIAMAADALIFKIRKSLTNGHITCDNGRYIEKGYEDYRQQVGGDYYRAQQYAPHLTLSRDLDAASFAICGNPIGRAVTLNYNSRAHYNEMNPRTLSSLFHGRAPVCTPESAAIAQAEMTHRQRVMEHALMAQSAPRPPRPVPRADYQNPMAQ